MAKLQLAFDTVSSEQAVSMVAGGTDRVDLIEVGTPMIKREGMPAIERIRDAFPEKLIVADMKTMDAGAYEAQMAFAAGADIITVLGCASDATISSALTVATALGKQVMVDLMNVQNLEERIDRIMELGVHYVGMHAGTDQQHKQRTLLQSYRTFRTRVRIPVAVAGGITSDTLEEVRHLHPDIVVVGSYVTSAADPLEALTLLRKKFDTVFGSDRGA